MALTPAFSKHVALGIPTPLTAFVKAATNAMIAHVRTRREDNDGYAMPSKIRGKCKDPIMHVTTTRDMPRMWSFMDGSNMRALSKPDISHYGWVSFMNFDNLEKALTVLASHITYSMNHPARWSIDWGACISFSRNMDDVFPLFADLDIMDKDGWGKEDIVPVIRHMQHVVMAFFHHDALPANTLDMLVLVAKRPDNSTRKVKKNGVEYAKSGIHIYWPNLIVNTDETMTIRQEWLRLLDMRCPRNGDFQNPWADVLDELPYKPGSCTGLRAPFIPKISRCLGCRGKSSMRCEDCRGRAWELEPSVYEPYLYLRGMDSLLEGLQKLKDETQVSLEEEGTVPARKYKSCVLFTLQCCNLWVPYDTPLTPGFHLPAGVPMWVNPVRGGAGSRKRSAPDGGAGGGGGGSARRKLKETAPPSSHAFRVLTDLVHMVAPQIADADVEEVEVIKTKAGHITKYIVTLAGDASRFCLNLNDHHRSVTTSYHITREHPVFEQRCNCRHDHIRPHTGKTCAKARLKGKCARLNEAHMQQLFHLTERQQERTAVYEDQVLNNNKEARVQYADMLRTQMCMMVYGKPPPSMTHDTVSQRHVVAITSLADCTTSLMTAEQLETMEKRVAAVTADFEVRRKALNDKASATLDNHERDRIEDEETEVYRSQKRTVRDIRGMLEQQDLRRKQVQMHQHIDLVKGVVVQPRTALPPTAAFSLE